MGSKSKKLGRTSKPHLPASSSSKPQLPAGPGSSQRIPRPRSRKSRKPWLIAAVLVLGAIGAYYFLKPQPAPPGVAAASLPGRELAPTLEVKTLNGRPVAFQNGLPYPMSDQQKREALSLDGSWKKQRLPGNHKLTMSAREPATITMLERENSDAIDPRFDDGAWQSCAVPSVENPSPDRHMDVAWYRKEFQLPSGFQKKRAVLTFEAANYVADVWVNGRWVGYHEGGFTPFSFDVTEFLRKGGNLITVRIDNIPWLPQKQAAKAEPANDSNIVPYATADWWNYGGMLRGIRLEAYGPITIQRAEARPRQEPGKTTLDVLLVTRNTLGGAAPVEIDLKVYPARLTEENLFSPYPIDIADLNAPVSKSNQTPEKADLPADAFFAIPCKLDLPPLETWELRNPKLYVLEARLLQDGRVADTVYVQFGVRDVATQKTKILVNGKPVFFRGAAAHETFPGSLLPDLKGKPEPGLADILRRDFQNLYDLNANFVRTGHRPAHPLTLLVADRLGIGVWEEIPVYWFGGKELDYQRMSRPIARQMFLEMIARDINRPSILVWGTCNECGAQKQRLDFIKDLREQGARLDTSRLIAQSAAGNDAFDRTHDACDFLGFTSYYGVFYGHTYGQATSKALEAMHAAHPDKALFATEFGIWSEKDLSNSENQIKCARETYEAFSRNPHVAGSIWWALNDWHTMITDPQSMGLVTFDGRRKPAYYALQELYAEREGRAFLKWHSPVKDRPIRDTVDVDLEMVSPSPFKSLAIELNGKPVAASKILPGGRFVFQFDSRTLPEGDNLLYARAENQRGTVLSQERTLFVDNVDEPPVLTKNLKSGDFVLADQLLQLAADDDRGVEKMEIQIDELPWQTLDPLYRPGRIYVSHLNFPAAPASGTHTLRIRLTDNGGQICEETLQLKPADVSRFGYIDLKFDRDWISPMNRLSDGTGWDFPAEELPASSRPFVFNSKNGPVIFKFGDKSDGARNCMEARGQKLELPPGPFKAIHILGAMRDGTTPLAFLVTSGEGLPRSVMLNFSDWWRGDPIYGEETVVKTGFHHERDNPQKKPGVGIYLQTIPIKEGKPVSITLPNDPRLAIFAVSLEK